MNLSSRVQNGKIRSEIVYPLRVAARRVDQFTRFNTEFDHFHRWWRQPALKLIKNGSASVSISRFLFYLRILAFSFSFLLLTVLSAFALAFALRILPSFTFTFFFALGRRLLSRTIII